jgi:hypothetical protein
MAQDGKKTGVGQLAVITGAPQAALGSSLPSSLPKTVSIF